MISETIKCKAKAKINLGVDPLKVHEWLMQQGCEAEEADKIIGCRTFPSEEKREKQTCSACNGSGIAADKDDCAECDGWGFIVTGVDK